MDMEGIAMEPYEVDYGDSDDERQRSASAEQREMLESSRSLADVIRRHTVLERRTTAAGVDEDWLEHTVGWIAVMPVNGWLRGTVHGDLNGQASVFATRY